MLIYENINVKSVDTIEHYIIDLKCFVAEWFSKNKDIPMSEEVLLANDKIKTLEWVLGVR